MKKIKKEMKEVEILESIVCDKCKKEFDPNADQLEIQDFLHIDFIGGYGSPFGDGNRVTCDICPDCTKEMISGFATIKDYRDT